MYRSFLGVLAQGSLSGAARALGVAQPTVGRHVTALEQALKLVLFTRTLTGLVPTEAALGLQPHAQAMASAAQALQRAAEGQGDGVQGTVRITASEMMGLEVLPPMLAQLQERHPGLRIELVLSNRVQNLLNREADIAVRHVRPTQGPLVARHVGTVVLGLHAHRRYLDQQGRPRHEDQLAQHRLIGHDVETPYLRQAGKALPAWRRAAFSARCDSDAAQFALIRAGAGIGVCQVPLARRDKALVRVLADRVAVPLEVWLAVHEDLRHSPRCKTTFDALAAGLSRYCGAAQSQGTASAGLA